MRQFCCLLPEFYLKSGIIADSEVPVKQLYCLFKLYHEKPEFFTVFQHFDFKNTVKKCLLYRSLYYIVVCSFLKSIESQVTAGLRT